MAIWILIAAFGSGFAVLHSIYRFTTAFQLLVAAMFTISFVRMQMHYHGTQHSVAKSIGKWYFISGLSASVFWMIDFHFCSLMQSAAVNPQGHAIWHLLMAVNTYLGPLFLMTISTEATANQLKITKALGILPVLQQSKKSN